MAKDYAKSTFKMTRTRQTQRSRRRSFWVIFLLVFVSMSAVLGGYLYRNKMTIFVSGHGQASAWLGELKMLLHRQKTQVAANPRAKAEMTTTAVPAETEVQFDFYTELPNMQVTLPVTQDEANKGIPLPVNNPINNTAKPVIHSAQKAPASDALIAHEMADIGETQPAHIVSTISTTDRNDSAITSKDVQYVVQVGAYKSDSTASEMRVSILLAGFDVKVVKSIVGDQVVYRIQQGPYNSLIRAKAAQKKLQAKGFEGVVQKLG